MRSTRPIHETHQTDLEIPTGDLHDRGWHDHFVNPGFFLKIVDVDHFIPWSRYPTDLGHNFVLVHPRCNNAKSAYLAAEQHLQSWADRNRTRSEELAERLQDAGLPSESSASIRITEWAYERVEKADGQVWLNDAVFLHLGPTWRELLVA